MKIYLGVVLQYCPFDYLAASTMAAHCWLTRTVGSELRMVELPIAVQSPTNQRRRSAYALQFNSRGQMATIIILSKSQSPR